MLLVISALFSPHILTTHAEEITTEQTKETAEPTSVDSIDANYILSSRQYSSTPKSEFGREPKYGAYDFSNIKIGDIIYESKFLNGIGHCAIVSDISHSSYYGDYIQTIEAVAGGVQYGFLDDTRMLEYEVYVCSPYLASMSNRQSAVDFCTRQLGKSYWYDTDESATDLDENQSNWYCSELIYAAYYNAMGRGLQCGALDDGHILPIHLYSTWETSDVVLFDDIFLKLSVDTSGSKWTINVKNPMSYTIQVDYNQKMCFEADARDWTNLTNQDTFSLEAKNSVSKRVKTNFLATHVTFSWKYSESGADVRIVSYANQLSSSGGISVCYNIIYL